MKKQTIIIITVSVIIILMVFIGQSYLKKTVDINLPQATQREAPTREVAIYPTVTPVRKPIEVAVDFGDGLKTSGTVEAKNAYEAINAIAREKKWQVVAKEYKYGVMVEKIDGKENNKTYFWSYSINGKPGQIAADQNPVNPGDKVEWIYKKL
ncbi:DUF4430 domain-containing protein [Candidatus Microgenomates bacterium]|nr:DUF4430 domain-containing protein [Candidatus Microgenomates bacterium]